MKVYENKNTDELHTLHPMVFIELKRGGFEIGSMEVAQAENYVRQIKKSGILHKASSIHVFVVGCRIGDIDTHKVVWTKETLEEHYKNLDDECLVEKALKEPAQIKMRLEN